MSTNGKTPKKSYLEQRAEEAFRREKGHRENSRGWQAEIEEELEELVEKSSPNMSWDEVLEAQAS